MSYGSIPLIRCDVQVDGDRCDTEWISPIGPARAHCLRAYLADLGWHRTRHGDVCPDCWTNGRRPTPRSS